MSCHSGPLLRPLKAEVSSGIGRPAFEATMSQFEVGLNCLARQLQFVDSAFFPRPFVLVQPSFLEVKV